MQKPGIKHSDVILTSYNQEQRIEIDFSNKIKEWWFELPLYKRQEFNDNISNIINSYFGEIFSKENENKIKNDIITYYNNFS